MVEEDLPVFFEQQRDPEAVEMAAFPSREREAFFEHWQRVRSGESNAVKTIVADGQVVGNVLSWEADGRRLVGYWLGREYWGKGIATRALALFLEQVKIRPLYAHVVEHNLASRRVLEKCGFAVWRRERVTDPDGSQVEEFVLKLGSHPEGGAPDKSGDSP